MFFCQNQTLMCIFNFYNYSWMFQRSKPIQWRKKITTQMFLCRRSLDSILIMSKFNLPNFKNFKWVFGQALISNSPLLDIKICRLQSIGLSFFLPTRIFSPICHRVFHYQIIQKQLLFIFPPYCLCMYKTNTINIIDVFCATLKMKLQNRFLQTLAFSSSFHSLFQIFLLI